LVYVINAKYIKDFKRVFPERDKTDFIDRQFIAEYLRTGCLPHPFEANNRYLPLQRLVRYRYHLVKNIERKSKFFLSNLFLSFLTGFRINQLRIWEKLLQMFLVNFIL